MQSRRGGGWSLEYDDIRRTYSPRVKGRGSPRFNVISSRYKRRVVLVAALLASDFAPTVTLFTPDIALPGTFAALVDVFRQPPRPQPSSHGRPTPGWPSPSFARRAPVGGVSLSGLCPVERSTRTRPANIPPGWPALFPRSTWAARCRSGRRRRYRGFVRPPVGQACRSTGAVCRGLSGLWRRSDERRGQRCRDLFLGQGLCSLNRPDRHPRHSSPCRGGMCHILPECRSALGQRLTWRPWPGSWRTRRRGWPGPCR